jgi:hypothetical protein
MTGQVSGDSKGEVSNVRTNSVGWVPAAGDPILESVEDRICGLFGVQPECTENFQVIHYEVNQEYKAHLDAYLRLHSAVNLPSAHSCEFASKQESNAHLNRICRLW